MEDDGSLISTIFGVDGITPEESKEFGIWH
jgi:hypothetical protein